MRIDVNGNVGVSTTAPRQQLSVGSYLDIYSGGVNTPGVASIRASLISTGNNNLILDAYGSGALYLNADDGAGGVIFQSGANVTVGSVTNAGALSMSSTITATSDIYANGTYYYGDNKKMFEYNDAWLRLNPAPSTDFTSGIYAGTGVLRTDGNFQVGASGAFFNVTSGGAVTIASSLSCTNCITEADIAASAVGATELKTSTGSTTCGAGAACAKALNDYNFFPSITDYKSTTPQSNHCLAAYYNAADPGDTVARFYLENTTCQNSTVYDATTIRWRYVAASDHPTIWVVVNPNGTTENGWEAEDPIEPVKYPENPNPIAGTTMKPGQYFLSPAPPSVDELKKVYADLPLADQTMIIASLSAYIVDQRHWLPSLSSLDDLNNMSDRYKPSGRQWAYRVIGNYYHVSGIDVIQALFTINSSASANLIAVNNSYQALMAYKSQLENPIPATNSDTNSADIAEWYKTGASGMEAGDLATIGMFNTIDKTTKPYDSKIIGVVSSTPNSIIGEKNGNFNAPLALTGRVPVKTTNMNGDIQPGDYLTSSPISGFAMKATKAGAVVGKALTSFDSSNATQSAQLVDGTWKIVDGTCTDNQLDCANIGTSIVFITISSYDPDVYLTTTGDVNVVVNATPSGNVNFPRYYNLTDALGAPITRMGRFLELVIGNLRVGAINAQEIATNALNVATENITINGQNIRDYIAGIVNSIIDSTNNSVNSPIASADQIHTGLISPIGSDATIGLKLDNNKLSVLNTNSASGSAVATIDNQGNASFSGQLTSNGLNTNDATISGTLHVGRIIADQIVGATSSATYVTNITNIYNSTPSAATNNNSSGSANTNFGLIANAATNGTSSASMPTTSGSYIDISSYSGRLSYVDNLSASTASFSQGLMVFGPTSLSDTSIVGQLSVNGNLILANDSINVLGSDLSLQPLRQGGLSIMGGLVYIDTDGNLKVGGNAEFAKNVTVKGTLTANVISPLPGNDLTLSLGHSDQPLASSSSQIQNTKYKIQNTDGSDVLSVNQLGDLVASGAATFSKLNLDLVQPALAVSPTEVVATGSAGTAQITPYQTQVTIDNALVTAKSLIYITPTSSTNNQVLYLLRQVPGKSFTVGMQNPSVTPIPFNWIIVN